MTLAALDLLAPVVADGTADLGTLDGLAVDAGGAGCFLATLSRADLGTQGINDLLPGAVLMPGGEVVVGRTLGHEVMGQVVPLDAGAGLVEQRVDHLTQIDRARTATRFGRRQERFEQRPLGIGEIRTIRL